VEHYPLSYGQAALWFIHESAPEATAYNVGVALRISAPLDAALLDRALNAVVERHPSLRATFSAQGEQIIAPAARVHLKCTDASAWDAGELKRRVEAAHRQPFQLGTGPLLRAELFSSSPNEHVLLLSLHHIVCDAHSVWTMLEDLQAAYLGRALAPMRATYADFVKWQREMLPARPAKSCGASGGSNCLPRFRRSICRWTSSARR
jgi:hypothetical protein